MLKGKIIELQSGIIVVPMHRADAKGWDCIVVYSTHQSYPVGGYDLFIFNEDLENGNVIELNKLKED